LRLCPRLLKRQTPEPEPESDVVDTVEEAKAKEFVTSFLAVSPGWARLDDIVEGVFGEATIQGYKIPTPTQVSSKLYAKGKVDASMFQSFDASKKDLLIRGRILGYMDDSKIKVNKTNLRKLRKQAYELSRELGVDSVGDFQGILGQMVDDLEGLKDYKRQLAKAERELAKVSGKSASRGYQAPKTRISQLASSGSLRDEIEKLKNRIADIEAMQSGRRIKIPAPKKPKVMSKDAYLGKHGVSGHYVDVGLQSPGRISKRRSRAASKMWIKQSHEYGKEQALRSKEYDEKVKAGEIRPPSYMEQTIEKSLGHPDNRSVQAARRLVAKNAAKGIISKSHLARLEKQWKDNDRKAA